MSGPDRRPGVESSLLPDTPEERLLATARYAVELTLSEHGIPVSTALRNQVAARILARLIVIVRTDERAAVVAEAVAVLQRMREDGETDMRQAIGLVEGLLDVR